MVNQEMAVETFYPCADILGQHCFIKRILQCAQAATSDIQIPVDVGAGAHMKWRFKGRIQSAFGGTAQSFSIESSPNGKVTLLSSKMVLEPSYPFTKMQDKPYLVNRIFPCFLSATSSAQEFLYLGAYKKWELQGRILSASEGSNQSSATKSSSRGREAQKESSGWSARRILGPCRTTMTAPLERVKLLLQSQSEMIKSGQLSKPYKGIVDCYKRTVKTDGLFSLWRGNAVNLVTTLLFEAIRSSANYWIHSVVSYDPKKDGYLKLFAGYFAGGALAAAVSVSIVHPLIYAHTRWANDVKSNVSKREFSSLRGVFTKTIRSEGVAGLYRGLSVSIAHICIKAVLSNLFYVVPEQMMGGLRFQHRIYAVVASIKGLDFFLLLATYPLDTVRRRMMMTCGQATKYESAVDAFSKIVKREGFRSLYKGAVAGSLKIVVECALYLALTHLWLMQAYAEKRKRFNIDGANTALQEKTGGGDKTLLQKKTGDGHKTALHKRPADDNKTALHKRRADGDKTALQKKTDDGAKTSVRIRFRF